MSDFDYGNARLHAMRSRLFTPAQLAELAGAGSLRGLINALTRTTYRENIEKALVQFSGMAALQHAWREDLVQHVTKAQRFFKGKAAEPVAWVVQRFDVDNIKAVLRGLSQHVPAGEILDATVPAGQLRPADLARLARVENPRAAVDLLATWRLPMAQSLLSLRAKRPGAALFEMELALERWYYRAAMASVNGRDTRSLERYLNTGADLDNILTSLRLVGSADAAAFLRQQFSAEDATPFFVGPGRLHFPLLAQMAAQPTLRRASARLDDTLYGPLLADVMRRGVEVERLSAFEDALTRYRLRFARNLLVGDPLGIGVLIGYLNLKQAEISNLGRIALGVQLGEPPEQMTADLLLTGDT